jgi:hypothetical protein
MSFQQSQADSAAKCGSSVARKNNVGVFGIGVVVVALQMQAGGFDLANADELAELLYPAGHVANCKPAPGFGCACDTDSTSQASTLSPARNGTHNNVDQIQDVELRRLVEWMRLTCAAITQPTDLR